MPEIIAESSGGDRLAGVGASDMRLMGKHLGFDREPSWSAERAALDPLPQCIKHPVGEPEFVTHPRHAYLFGLEGKVEVSVIAALDANCTPRNVKEIAGELGRFCIANPKTVRAAISSLIRKGLVENILGTPQDIANILRQKDLKGKGLGSEECAWCRTKTIAVEEHHFPKQRSEGGTQTVSICGTCHREYHALHSEVIVAPTSKLLNALDEDAKRYQGLEAIA